LGVGASPLGVFPDGSWEPGEVRIEPGDLLFLYTDGITEARSNGEFFGEKRLQDLIREVDGPVDEIPGVVLDKVLDFSGGALQDDLAILAVLARESNTWCGPEQE
jgi:sigma-B regulation protein RsbU (phosphoserine phosphatase)